MEISPAVEEFISAFTDRDEERVIATFDEAVELDAPFPLGKKKGAKKAAKSLLNVAKLGIVIGNPSIEDGCHQSFVKSPAGDMVLRFTLDGERIVRLDIAKP